MRVDGRKSRRGTALLGVVALLLGCSDALEQTTAAGDVVVVVNSGSGTLSLITVQQRTVTFVPIPPPVSTPRTIAILGGLVAVPGGDSAALTVFGFDNGQPSADTTWQLPPGASTSGVALESDSIAWVTNPSRNTVTRLNVHTGGITTFAVGVSPQAVVVAHHLVYVVNANVVNGVPAGPSWITLVPGTGAVRPASDSTPLTGTNARFATLGADGFIYVSEAGTPGQADGKLSIVDTASRREQAVLNGLGESPGPLVYHPTGRILVASLGEGILEVNTATRTVVRGPGDGVKPTGVRFAALTLDPTGRVYALDQGNCSTPGALYVLGSPPGYDMEAQLTVGVCPAAAATVLIPS